MIDFIMNAPTIGDAIYNGLTLFGMITVAGIYVADKMGPKQRGDHDDTGRY